MPQTIRDSVNTTSSVQPKSDSVEIAFFSDNSMLPGLHVALLTLGENYAGTKDLRVTIFCDRIPDLEKNRLEQTFELSGAKGSVRLNDANIPTIHGANSLHGNRTAYGRVFLADLMPRLDAVIYLDCDVYVGLSIDVLIQHLACSTKTLVASGVKPRSNSRDRQLFDTAGLDMRGMCFNSGVLGLNLARWRQNSRTDDILATAKRFPGMFYSADQALLNVVFSDDYTPLSDNFNFHAYPTSSTENTPSDAIIHFVGSPKPWDLFGKQLHKHYHFWESAYNRTAIASSSPYRYISLKRAVSISRSVLSTWARMRHERLR